ncbi:MAG: histidine phosphatase family protein [Myxococcota bacterium]|nr:histidine phosphatase family protein [Myxococcota bacterium]
MEIVLVRHAESIWNAENRWQGQTDVPLSDRGREEARRLGARLSAMSFDRRLCSDLSRARDTAAAIGGEIEFDRALREMDLGSWGGLLHSEVRERHPEQVAAMIAGAPMRIGGGESIPELEKRAQDTLARIVRTSRPGDRVLVVTHGGVIRALLMSLLGARARRPLIGATNTSITHLRVDARGGIALAAYNCSAHLDPREGEDDDELASGAPDEVIRRTIAHLGLASSAADRFCAPPAGTITRLARGSEPALRAFAIPALSEPISRPA